MTAREIDDAGARRHALQGAEEDQRADVIRQGAAGRRQREHDQAAEHHRTPAEAVRERAVEQVHDGEAEQVGRERLLHLDRRGADRLGDAGEGRQVGVDRERPEHAQAGQEHGQGPAGRLPEVGRRGSWSVCHASGRKSVKRADRPDSVQRAASRDALAVAAIPLGRASLPGSVLPTRRLVRSHTSRPRAEARAARAGLFGIAARRDCPFHPKRPPCGRRLDSSLLL